MSTITIIDSDDYAASGIEVMTFPGGEPHVKIPTLPDGIILPALKLRTWLDVGYATLLLDAIERQRPAADVRPFIPYFPGARQERSDGTAPITLELMRKMLNSRWIINVLDLHSYSAHRPACNEFHFADLMPARRAGVVGIIAPDEGAHGRAHAFREGMYPLALLIQCSKSRDSHTGALSGYLMPPLEKPGHYIVVDDICDGGGTFNLLAEAFDADPIGKRSTLELVVSHGIFSKGLKNLSPRYQWITTSASWCDPELQHYTGNKRLTVLPLDPIINRIAKGEYP